MGSLPDFSTVDFDAAPAGSSSPLADWKALVGERAEQPWQTPEGIPVKPMYTAADLDAVTHLDS